PPNIGKQPILSMLKKKGGVNPDSLLAQELRALGITQKTNPGLYKKSGFFNEIDAVSEALIDNEALQYLRMGDDGRADYNDALDAVWAEHVGSRRYTADEQKLLDDYENELSSLEALEDELLNRGLSAKDSDEFIAKILENDVAQVKENALAETEWLNDNAYKFNDPLADKAMDEINVFEASLRDDFDFLDNVFELDDGVSMHGQDILNDLDMEENLLNTAMTCVIG
ncbi:MAG: hypothetical protein ACK5LE_06905, partial [Alphaproteobacteria bacterium]